MRTKKIFDPAKMEKKWNKVWLENGIYEVNLEKAGKPFYNLMMFPYPSAEGLHVGNVYAFTGTDVYGRFQRMQGKDVFEPIGLDGFGIHSENFAMKVGRHPKEHAKISEEHFYDQLSKIGNGYAWRHRLETYNPEYYKWTQWLFARMFEKGLAYKGKAKVNWCPSCKTVLADEQVEGGVCERCKTAAQRKEMESWYFRITDYAQRLLDNIEKIDWPESIKTAQRNWIGKKEGVKVKFDLKGLNKKSEIEIFTTRLDTIFGVTFLVVAPEHPVVGDYLWYGLDKEGKNYLAMALAKTEQARKEGEKVKTGVNTGSFAVNPVTGEEIPIYIADYVMMDMGTGAVMGVPAHDKRDFEFAAKYNLPVKEVVRSLEGSDPSIFGECYEDKGKLINSGKYDGLESNEAIKKMLADFGDVCKYQVHFHLRDWLISRQRYWGAPIPMVNCAKCGWVALKQEDLPLELPDMDDFEPEGTGKGPLSKLTDWKKTVCPKCGGEAERETDVCDTFLDSAWYYLAYPFIKNKKWQEGANPFEEKVLKKWLPVNAYIGGAEHAVLHLLYSRFASMALHDWGYLDFEEPFPFLYSHGLIIKDGSKMSKSRGNVINPDEYIEKYGADTLRAYLMFLGPYNQGGDFRDTGMAGMYKWLERVWKLFGNESKLGTETSGDLKRKLHWAIKKVGEDYVNLRYNTVVAALMELTNEWKKEGAVMSQSDGVCMLKLLAPLAPFMTEELYQVISNKAEGTKFDKKDSIHWQRWPEYDEALLVEDLLEIAVQENGKLRDTLKIEADKVADKDFVLEQVRNLSKIAKILEGKRLVKEIYVPGKVVNLVMK